MIVKHIFFTLISFILVSTLSAQTIKSMQWSTIGTLPTPSGMNEQCGLAGALIGIHRQNLVIAGGANFPDAPPWQGGTKTYHKHLYQARLKRGMVEWVNISTLPAARAYSANVSTPWGIICIGGENELGPTDQVWLIKTRPHSPASCTELPPLPKPLSNATATILGNKIYVVGGENQQEVSSAVYYLDWSDRQKGWQIGPSLPQPVSHALVLADGSTLFLIGGRKRNHGAPSDFYTAVWQLKTDQSSWQSGPSLPFPLSAHSGVVFNHHLVVISGDQGHTFRQVEQINIDLLTEAHRAQSDPLNTHKQELLNNHPGFSKTVLLLNIGDQRWHCLDPMTITPPVTTTAVKYQGAVVLSNGEIKPGQRTPHIFLGTINDDRP